MYIRNAKVHDLARVPGVSVALARRIRERLRDDDDAGLDDVDEIAGVGEGTMGRIEQFFYER